MYDRLIGEASRIKRVSSGYVTPPCNRPYCDLHRRDYPVPLDGPPLIPPIVRSHACLYVENAQGSHGNRLMAKRLR